MIVFGSSSGFSIGQIRSINEWEPQCIFIYENPKDSDKVIFEFCTTKQGDHCYRMGKEGGIPRSILEEESKFMKEMEIAIPYIRPIGTLLLLISGYRIALKVAPAWAFVVGGGTEKGLEEFSNKKSFLYYWEDIRLAIDPKFGIQIQVSSIIDFSKVLENILDRLKMPCVQNPKSQSCNEWNKKIKESYLWINERFPPTSLKAF